MGVRDGCVTDRKVGRWLWRAQTPWVAKLCARPAPRVSLRLASPYTLRASRGARISCYGEGSPARDPRARPSHLCSMGRKRGRAHSLHRAPWLPCAMGQLADGIRMPHAGPKERMRSPERARRPEGANALARPCARLQPARYSTFGRAHRIGSKSRLPHHDRQEPPCHVPGSTRLPARCSRSR